jgi:hypothetical protein
LTGVLGLRQCCLDDAFRTNRPTALHRKDAALGVKRIARTFLAAGVAIAGLSLNMTGTAMAAVDPNPDPSVYYELFLPSMYNNNYNLCMDVPNASTSAGTRLQMYHCHASDGHGGNQLWRFWLVPGSRGWDNGVYGSYVIINQHSGMCLSVGETNDEYVRQEPCDYSSWTQQWSTTASGIDFDNVGLFQLVTPIGTCMSALSGSTGNGTPVWAGGGCDYSTVVNQVNTITSWELG